MGVGLVIVFCFLFKHLAVLNAVGEDLFQDIGEWQTLDRFTRDTSTDKSVKVLGSTTTEVPVYVKVNHDSPYLLCITQHLRNGELIDPSFQWTGPDGNELDVNRVLVKSTGTLQIPNFRRDMTGLYTCTLYYTEPIARTASQVVLRFFLYAFQEPFLSYKFSVRYHTGSCFHHRRRAFTEKLSTLLNKLVSGLSCDVSIINSMCHEIKLPQAGMQHELFIEFEVTDINPVSEKKCTENINCDGNQRVIKAKNLIEDFFKIQTKSIEHSKGTLPLYYYIGGTLQAERIDHCFPGLGVDKKKHAGCSECCVICSPGTYNPNNAAACYPCESSVAYGEQTCF